MSTDDVVTITDTSMLAVLLIVIVPLALLTAVLLGSEALSNAKRRMRFQIKDALGPERDAEILEFKPRTK